MAGYIGSKASVVSSGAERKKTFAITTSTTSLTGLVYTPNKVHVFHNGIRLVDGTDYTATDGTTITLTNAAADGDEVVVVSYATFQTSDTVSASAGGTFSNAVTVTGNLNTADVLPSTDDTSDLGSTAKRFQDLYLSGGAYLGGTGSSNYLDDYEEGTWTPVLTGSNGATKTWSYSAQAGYYRKVGGQVTVWYNIQLSSNGSGTDGNAFIDGLPFVSANNSDLVAHYSVVWKQLVETGDVGLMTRQQVNSSTISIIDGSSSYPDITYINTSVFTNDRRIRGTMTYLV